MPTYKQRIRFEKEFVIEARDASEANDKLHEAVHRTEWDSDVQNEGYYDFEDEPVKCPKCKGACVLLHEEDEVNCDRCGGDGVIPFVAESQ